MVEPNGTQQFTRLPEHRTVQVEVPGEHPYSALIGGRTAQIILWLIEQREEIEKLGAGALELNLGPKRVKPIVRAHFPSFQAIPERTD